MNEALPSRYRRFLALGLLVFAGFGRSRAEAAATFAGFGIRPAFSTRRTQ